ncbi:FHA-HIT [Obelidium mucronatum]|nr:FHA-HIT [Obelidium mucronatum]
MDPPPHVSTTIRQLPDNSFCMPTEDNLNHRDQHWDRLLDLKGVSALSATDLPMLESLAHTLKQVQQAHPSVCFKAGFHAVPSMAHLHMHIISDDMVSPCLKHKKHWNSFTTRFFIPLQDVIFEITEKGSVEVNVEESEALLKADLQCHKCTKTCKNMPELKKHLESHLEKEALLSNKAE